MVVDIRKKIIGDGQWKEILINLMAGRLFESCEELMLQNEIDRDLFPYLGLLQCYHSMS